MNKPKDTMGSSYNPSEIYSRISQNNIGSLTQFQTFRRGFLIRHPTPATTAAGAVNLIATLPDVPLRTPDAMHLVIAREIDASILATADRIMAAGAHEMGFSVVRFFKSSRS